uniref:Threonine aspartase 1 n=1 Tax=Schistocephalus solidus TaxID=70667 RepID=A0A0X3PGR8_SCHSO
MFSVAVHAGAGFHSKANEKSYKELCTDACCAAANILRCPVTATSAIDAATAAVRVLEDHILTNAGFGSCLSVDGTVECDAGVMCGRTLKFCSVGSVSCIKNPINVARSMLIEHLSSTASETGRIKPLILCGEGAMNWARDVAGIPLVPSKSLISKPAHEKWKKYCKLVNQVEGQLRPNELQLEPELPLRKRPRLIDRMDTVGAVCIDSSGNVCAALSSGGIPLKVCGRIGQACVYGCGSWAEITSALSVGVVTSGTGEQLIKTQLAQKLAESILSDSESLLPDVVSSSFERNFLNSRFLFHENTEKFGGAAGILLRPEMSGIVKSAVVEFFFIHSTQSLAYAYFASNMLRPQSGISRKPPSSNHASKYFALHCTDIQ